MSQFNITHLDDVSQLNDYTNIICTFPLPSGLIISAAALPPDSLTRLSLETIPYSGLVTVVASTIAGAYCEADRTLHLCSAFLRLSPFLPADISDPAFLAQTQDQSNYITVFTIQDQDGRENLAPILITSKSPTAELVKDIFGEGSFGVCAMKYFEHMLINHDILTNSNIIGPSLILLTEEEED